MLYNGDITHSCIIYGTCCFCTMYPVGHMVYCCLSWWHWVPHHTPLYLTRPCSDSWNEATGWKNRITVCHNCEYIWSSDYVYFVTESVYRRLNRCYWVKFTVKLVFRVWATFCCMVQWNLDHTNLSSSERFPVSNDRFHCIHAWACIYCHCVFTGTVCLLSLCIYCHCVFTVTVYLLSLCVYCHCVFTVNHIRTRLRLIWWPPAASKICGDCFTQDLKTLRLFSLNPKVWWVGMYYEKCTLFNGRITCSNISNGYSMIAVKQYMRLPWNIMIFIYNNHHVNIYDFQIIFADI